MDYGQQPDGQQPPAPGAYPPPGGQAPPDPATPQGYQPPGSTYGPPPGSEPYQPGQSGGGYGGGYQAPPKKGGFNWLACCGIGCGVVLVVGILVCVLMWKVIAPFVGMGMEVNKLSEEVKAADINTIMSSAVEVDDKTLAADPAAYAGQWVMLDAVLGDENQSGSANFGNSPATSYVTENMVMISDVSNAPRVALKGDSIVAYGKVYVMDVAEMMKSFPGAKEEIEKSMAEQNMPGGAKIAMFFAKSVEKAGGVDEPTGMDDSAAPSE
jgi:hypothetical protein